MKSYSDPIFPSRSPAELRFAIRVSRAIIVVRRVLKNPTLSFRGRNLSVILRPQLECHSEAAGRRISFWLIQGLTWIRSFASLRMTCGLRMTGNSTAIFNTLLESTKEALAWATHLEN